MQSSSYCTEQRHNAQRMLQCEDRRLRAQTTACCNAANDRFGSRRNELSVLQVFTMVLSESLSSRSRCVAATYQDHARQGHLHQDHLRIRVPQRTV